MIVADFAVRSADVSASHDFMLSLKEVNTDVAATAAAMDRRRDKSASAAVSDTQPHNKMVVKHSFVPCVEDELQVKQGEYRK